MRCMDALNLIDANVDGQLSEAMRQRHDAHIAACARCEAALADARRVAEATRKALDIATPADDFARRVVASLSSRPAGGLRWRVRRPSLGGLFSARMR